jgi:hypothetical protein
VKYTVKTRDGELTYGSLEEVKTAYVLGLIEPDDEVLEENARLWRKAGAIPLLITAKKVTHDRGQSNQQRAWAIGALVMAIFCFYFLIKGYWLTGVLTGFAVAVLLFQVTVLASKRKK